MAENHSSKIAIKVEVWDKNTLSHVDMKDRDTLPSGSQNVKPSPSLGFYNILWPSGKYPYHSYPHMKESFVVPREY